MFCPRCGARISQGQNYCTLCGQRAAAYGPAPQSAPLNPPISQAPPPQASAERERVERHLHVLWILWIVWAIIRVAPGVGLLFFGKFIIPSVPFAFRTLLMPFAAAAGAYFLAYAALCFVTGIGLMQRQPWARIVAIIAAILGLIHPVLGTALGIYTLWVLVPSESEAEYRRICGE